MKKVVFVIISLIVLNSISAINYQVLDNSLLLIEGELNMDYVQKNGEEWELFIPLFEQEDIILLPKNAVIKKIETLRDYQLKYDKGIIVTLNGNESISLITYALTPENKENYTLPISLITIFFIIFLIQYAYYKKNVYKKILKTLTENEKKIVNALIENDKQLTQSNLRKKTKLPKSTLSRIIDSLTKKEIIIKEQKGITNKIILK